MASNSSADMKPAGSWKASVRPTELSNSQNSTALNGESELEGANIDRRRGAPFWCIAKVEY